MKNASFAEILLRELYENWAKPDRANVESLDPAYLRAERSQVYYALHLNTTENLKAQTSYSHRPYVKVGRPLCNRPPTYSHKWTSEEQKIISQLVHLGHLTSENVSESELRIQFKKFLKVYHPDVRCTKSTDENSRKRISNFFMESKALFEKLLKR